MVLQIGNSKDYGTSQKLNDAISEYKRILKEDDMKKLDDYCGTSPPSEDDVIRLTADIDRDFQKHRRTNRCVGARLVSILQALQKYSIVVDHFVSGSQQPIASAIWGVIKFSLQVACAYPSYFDDLTALFMTIGRHFPKFQMLKLLYPKSKELRNALCEYYIAVVGLCKKSVLFLQKKPTSRLWFTTRSYFESEFAKLRDDLEELADNVRFHFEIESAMAQRKEAMKAEKSRDVTARIWENSLQSRREVEKRRNEKTIGKFLAACSTYPYQKALNLVYQQARTTWLFDKDEYKQWKQEKNSATLWISGKLGSGKTVLSASVVENILSLEPGVVEVAYYFCRYDESVSLDSRTIIGCLAKQIFARVQSEIPDFAAKVSEIEEGVLDSQLILGYLEDLLPIKSKKYFVILDGIDDCSEKEIRLLMGYLQRLLNSGRLFYVYYSSRPDFPPWASTLLTPQLSLTMSENGSEIERYIEIELHNRLEEGCLCVSNLEVLCLIQDTLLKKAHGMFLWVVLQIEAICQQRTDEGILNALKDLPKDLPSTFNRILQKVQLEDAADPSHSRKILGAVAAARRPLTKEELRVAICIEPGQMEWNPRKLDNKIDRSLHCGGLLILDELHLTIHFAHQSVKQHLISAAAETEIPDYHMKPLEADIHLGKISVTYLHFGMSSREIEKSNPGSMPKLDHLTSAIVSGDLTSAVLKGNLPQASQFMKRTQKLLKGRGEFNRDISRTLEEAFYATRPKSYRESENDFKDYAQDNWLYHSRLFTSEIENNVYDWWVRLIEGNTDVVKLPWTSQNSKINWMVHDEHWALISHTLDHLLSTKPSDFSAIGLCLSLLPKTREVPPLLTRTFEHVLFEAVEDRNETIVQQLVDRGISANSHHHHHQDSILAVAAYAGATGTMKLLLERGADVNAQGGRYSTPLHAASAHYRNVEAVHLLLINGANVNKGGTYFVNSTGRYILSEGGDFQLNALQAALMDPDKNEIVRLLLEYGADPKDDPSIDMPPTKAELMKQRLIGRTSRDPKNARLMSFRGAMHHLDKQLEFLPEISGTLSWYQNALGDDRDEYANTLQNAAYKFDGEILLEFLNRGEDVNAEGGFYGSAIQAAAASKKESSRKIDLLLERGAKVNTQNGVFGNPLQAAACMSNEAALVQLLRAEADVNAQGGAYGNPLQAVALSCSEASVQMMLTKGANVHAQGGHLGNALQAAALSSIQSTRKVQLLLEAGADPNTQGGEYGNALQAAAYSSDKSAETLQLLLSKSAMVNAQGGYWGTALQAAASSEVNFEIKVKLLLEAGADANIAGQGGSPLVLVASRLSRTCIKLLLDNGADILAKHIIDSSMGQPEMETNVLEAAVTHLRFGASRRKAAKGTVQFLLKKGAKAGAPKEWYDIALKSKTGNEELRQLVRDAKAGPFPESS